jgi:hypothetical protein
MMKPRHAHAGGLDARSLVRVITSVWLAASTPPALAWVYPEHRDIAVLAVQELDPQHQAEFDEMWQVARSGQEARLCVQAAVLGQGVAPECIDWAALPAIAGDHSCSSRQMLDTVVSSQWILVVADVAAQLKVDLAQARDNKALQPSAGMPTMVANVSRHLDDAHERAEIVNALRTANIRMLRADPAYATRADANNAHSG